MDDQNSGGVTHPANVSGGSSGPNSGEVTVLIDSPHGVPRWVKSLAALIVVLIILLTFTMWAVIRDEQQRCERVATVRDDSRDMWNFAIDNFLGDRPEGDPEVKAFTDYLDERLPHLECRGFFGRIPEPIGEP